MHTAVWPIVLLVIFAASPGVFTREPSASESLRAGDAAAARREWTQAIRHYSAAIQADPGAGLGFSKRAAAHGGMGDFGASLRDLSSALQLASGSIKLRLQRGRLRCSLCDFGGAEEDFRAVLATKPMHAAAERELDNVTRGMQALGAARIARDANSDATVTRGHLSALFGLATHCSEAKLIEATLLLLEKDFGGAVAITGQVLKAEPSNREALLTRSRAYYMLADLDMAKRHLGEVLSKIDPEDGQALSEFRKIKKLTKAQAQGEAAMARRQWKDAQGHFAKALLLDEAAEAVNAGLWRGNCKAALAGGMFTEALHAAKQLRGIRPDEAEPRVLLVKVHLLGEEFDKAVAEARSAMEAHTDDRSVDQVYREAEKRKKMAARKDYYKILGVAGSAHPREIKQAYRKMAKQLHPDKAVKVGLTKEAAEKKFHDIAEAYEVLSDEDKRGRFDRGEDVEVDHEANFHNPFGGGFGGGGQQFTFHFGG